MNQTEAKQRFDNLSFFIFSNLPRNSEFGFDGKVFVVDKFDGVKFIPAGLHLFLFSAAPSQANPETVSAGVGVRQGLLRFFDQREIIMEDWDNVQEELISDRDGGGMRRRVLGKVEISTNLISEDRLKGLDSSLAAYPVDLGTSWKPLVSFITPSTIARVIGIDERGNARVDAVMGSLADEEELKAAGGRRTWGKGREEDIDTNLEDEDMAGELLKFLKVETKRSWPVGAVGEELTRWSQDKSWLLSDAILTQLGGSKGVQEFLGELQLSFVLFTLLHNFSSLAAYKSLFSILCRSTSLLLPPINRSGASTSIYTKLLLNQESLPLYASFFAILLDQFKFLDQEFFSVQMPGLDIYLLTELDLLSVSLSEASPFWNSFDGPGGEIWRIVVERWDQLTRLTMEKFGWELSMIRASRKDGYTGITRSKEREDEVDIEELEEGEDAPVIVDM